MADERLTEIRAARLEKRATILTGGGVPYPAEAKRSHTIAAVQTTFEQLHTDATPVTIVGRITSIRRHGGVAFLDLQDGTGSLQLQVSKQELPADIFNQLDLLDTGDFLQAAGHVTTTQRGVRTLAIHEFHHLTKSIRPLPSTWHGLKDHETRYRHRELDLLLNEESRRIIEYRSRVITWLRRYLTEHGYLEVETPILQTIPGGAAARPFVTHHHALDIPLYLRISAELYLKRLLVAGYEKVFEIERRFRNEGIDRQHNPEFTMLESQWAYADYEDLMTFTEDTLDQLCRDLTGSTNITWQGTVLSFAKPFARERYTDLVSERLGVDILTEKDPATYLAIYQREGLEQPAIPTYYQLVDELYKKLVRPTLIQPTLLYDYPAEMAPLAKRSAHDPRIAEKFQLIAHGLELNNCYTELNDPVLQRQLLVDQQQQRDQGDEEAHTIDEDYLRAMEYGMPPNAGWSLGIDRFVMLLADAPSIRDTITFPLLRPDHA